MGIAFYNLEMRRQSVVVHDILKLGAVGNLIGLDGPFPRTFKTLGDGFRNLTNRVAGAVVWDGSVDTGWSLACAEPCFGLIFGGGKALDVCGQCANNLLRAVADNLKDNTTRRLLQAGLIAIAVVLEFGNLKVKRNGDIGNARFDLDHA